MLLCSQREHDTSLSGTVRLKARGGDGELYTPIRMAHLMPA